ncbi:MAG TPA: efflux RND transporter periplasmic adaptor subunit [Steroidobacteraceae bacterium]|nr:efflux RND transporter periplasmic adaptor subunit [Steroidobacteraceae bacterium]
MTESDETTTAHARKPRTVWILALIGAALLLIVIVRLIAHKPAHRGMPPQVVTVAQAVRGNMPETLAELGTVTPVATVTVLPQLSGYLTRVGYREGEDVRRGQFLAQIDPRQYQIGLRQAEAQLSRDQAVLGEGRSDLARYLRLRKQHAIAEQTVVDQQFSVAGQQAQVRSDQANIAQFRLDLDYTHITAPVAGRVGLRLVDPGNYVTAASSPGIVVITTMRPMTVVFNVAQADLAKVIARFHAGATLPVTALTSDNARTIGVGRLYAIGNQMNTGTGTVPLRASFANTDEAMFPNEFVNVRVRVDTLRGALLVPTSAVLSGAPGEYVYLVGPDHTVAVRKVTVGPGNGRDTAILAGLAAGDTVVIDGTDRLTDGARIQIAGVPSGGARRAAGAGARGAPPARANPPASRSR